MTGRQEINLPGIHWTDARRFFAYIFSVYERPDSGSEKFCLLKPAMALCPMRA
jgi:hypothetical protein